MPRQIDQDKLRKLMKANNATKRKANPSLSKHQLMDDLKKLKKVAGESARSTMVVDAPNPEVEKSAVSNKKENSTSKIGLKLVEIYLFKSEFIHY